MNLQYCPTAESLAASARKRSRRFPRLYARHEASGQVYEVSSNQHDCNARTFEELSTHYGRGWQLWIEPASRPPLSRFAHLTASQPARSI